jgi:hypothetical protein
VIRFFKEWIGVFLEEIIVFSGDRILGFRSKKLEILDSAFCRKLDGFLKGFLSDQGLRKYRIRLSEDCRFQQYKDAKLFPRLITYSSIVHISSIFGQKPSTNGLLSRFSISYD